MLLSHGCGGPDSAVAAGTYDATIAAQAKALKAYGYPVLLRWFWEMNLPTISTNPTCLGPSTTAAANYVAAYRHIVTIFRQVGGTNVAFVWAPSAAVHAPSAVAFYPGSAYVDWIGFDLYDRPNRPLGFAPTFAPTYATYASYGKPMAITETGAVGGAVGVGGGSPTQGQWLNQIATSLPADFPAVHAVVYVDAVDLYDYTLNGSGLSQFTTMGSSIYFSPMG
jgi:beta-mannanase